MQIFPFFRFKLVDYFHKQFACEKQKDRLLSYSQYYTNWPELLPDNLCSLSPPPPPQFKNQQYHIRPQGLDDGLCLLTQCWISFSLSPSPPPSVSLSLSCRFGHLVVKRQKQAVVVVVCVSLSSVDCLRNRAVKNKCVLWKICPAEVK